MYLQLDDCMSVNACTGTCVGDRNHCLCSKAHFPNVLAVISTIHFILNSKLLGIIFVVYNTLGSHCTNSLSLRIEETSLFKTMASVCPQNSV